MLAISEAESGQNGVVPDRSMMAAAGRVWDNGFR
jgi:hypothetical protein